MAFLSGNEKRLKETGRNEWERGKNLVWEMRWRQIKRGAAATVVTVGGLTLAWNLAVEDGDFKSDSPSNSSTRTEKNINNSQPAKLNLNHYFKSDDDDFYTLPNFSASTYVSLHTLPKDTQKTFTGSVMAMYEDYIYFGGMKDGEFHGYGELSHRKQFGRGEMIYKGEFVDGKKHGFGKRYHENGNIYEGDFRDNKQEGQGTYYDAKLDMVYIGPFKNNVVEGYGKVYDAQGAVVRDGLFKDGKYVEPRTKAPAWNIN